MSEALPVTVDIAAARLDDQTNAGASGHPGTTTGGDSDTSNSQVAPVSDPSADKTGDAGGAPQEPATNKSSATAAPNPVQPSSATQKSATQQDPALPRAGSPTLVVPTDPDAAAAPAGGPATATTEKQPVEQPPLQTQTPGAVVGGDAPQEGVVVGAAEAPAAIPAAVVEVPAQAPNAATKAVPPPAQTATAADAVKVKNQPTAKKVVPPSNWETRSANQGGAAAAAKKSTSSSATPSRKRKGPSRKAGTKSGGAWVSRHPEPTPIPDRPNDRPLLNPRITYPLDPRTIDIRYWPFDLAQPQDTLLHAQAKHYLHRCFVNSIEDYDEIVAVHASQPMINGGERYNFEQVPLHLHANAQLFSKSGKTVDNDGNPIMPDIVSDTEYSLFYIVTEANWAALTLRQKQEVLRRRCAVVYKVPSLPKPPVDFDEDGFAEYTHNERLAFVQDLGFRQSAARESTPGPTDADQEGGGPYLKKGRPSDLIYCHRQRLAREEAAAADGADPPQEDQALNLLSNLVPDLTVMPPVGWNDLATHEVAYNFLRNLDNIPTRDLRWSEVKWSIFANRRTFIGRRKPGLKDGRGDPRLRHCLDDFDGWTSMTDHYDFECVHLDQNTTLFMSATRVHCVLTIEDSIGAGMHGLPGSNTLYCVLTALHNLITDRISTNASHEKSRLFLAKNWEFFVIVLTDPGNSHVEDGRERGEEDKVYVPQRICDHVPDLETADGILDILALRSYMILYFALTPSAYIGTKPSTVKPFARALNITEHVWQAIMCSWGLAIQLDDYISENYNFIAKEGCKFETFYHAGNEAVISMAVAMASYREARTDLKQWLPFTSTEFEAQLRQMLGRFCYIHVPTLRT
ncbi:hypothetical protein C8F04DRAFT_1273791 [Mycena alexandri]|uniref:Uncharacterized protein n=1 Tax=Mycena alexandri TaxID=1745969 RepID=A0AAD6S530_9AGAR|nr:hypothetical protein C8F04DRAFT_1273791 [Mycena alexandri]